MSRRKIELPKKPWTVLVPMMELYMLAVFCAACAVRLRSPVTATVEVLLMFIAAVFLMFAYGLQRGRKDVAGMLVVWVVICGALGAVFSFAVLHNWIFGSVALVLSLPVLLVCLPSARQWFAAAEAMRSREKGCLGAAANAFAWVSSVLAAIAVLIASLKTPGSNTASRIMKYEDRDALISNEAEQVIRMFDFEQYGTKYTAIVLKPVSALASGPAVLVADATGRIIARCSDCGDDTGFCERWALMALTREDFRSEDVEAERTHDFSEDVWPGRGNKAYEQELLDWAH